MIKNHPYQNIYFNSFAKNSARNFELDYGDFPVFNLLNILLIMHIPVIDHAYTGTPLIVSNFNDGLTNILCLLNVKY